MIKATQEYPVEAMVFRAVWQSEAPMDGFPIVQDDESPSEFLIDLAERIASLCVQSQDGSDTADPALPLPQHADAPDRYCHIQSTPRDVPALVRPDVTLFTSDGNVRPLGDIEADIIRLAVSRYGGRISEVARRLNIGRSTLYRKLDELGISYTNYRSD